MNVYTLPELVIKAKSQDLLLPKKPVNGKCILCSKETEQGHRIKDTLSGNFTNWPMLSKGNCVCPTCYTFFKDQTHRRKSWIVTEKEFRVLDKEEKKAILWNVPDPPFFIHIAHTGQKQPWITCIHKVAYSKNKFYFTHENFGEIFFERQKAEHFRTLIKEALSRKITKTELLTQFRMKTYEKAWKDGFEDLLEEIKKHRKNLLWEVIVTLA